MSLSAADVDIHQGLPRQSRHGRRMHRPLNLSEPFAHPGRIRGFSDENVRQHATTSVVVDFSRPRLHLGRGQAPRKIGKRLGKPLRCRTTRANGHVPVVGERNVLDRVVGVGFVQVPGRKCPAQPLRTTDCDFAGAKHIAPRSGAPVPVDERP